MHHRSHVADSRRVFDGHGDVYLEREIMLKLAVDSNGNLTATQQDVSPSVYLDHWAFMNIAGDDQKVVKLVTILNQKNGTLYISFVHLLELSTVNDSRHAKNSVHNFFY